MTPAAISLETLGSVRARSFIRPSISRFSSPATLAKKLPAFADLLDCLFERDGHPLVFAPLACSLEHFSQAIGIIGCLEPCLALWAY